MVKTLEEKNVFAGVVEETRLNNFKGFDRWNFTCGKCSQRMRVKSGAAEYDCPICKTSYKVAADGRVFRVELVDVEDAFDIAVQNRSHRTLTKPQARTGLLGRLAGAVTDANEEAHGKRLLDELNSTGQSIKKLEGWVAEGAIAGFLEKRTLLNMQLPNWSIEGRIKMGKTLQAEARKKFDFSQAESYSLWMAGAWLESGARCSDSAASVHDVLERLARDFAD